MQRGSRCGQRRDGSKDGAMNGKVGGALLVLRLCWSSTRGATSLGAEGCVRRAFSQRALSHSCPHGGNRRSQAILFGLEIRCSVQLSYRRVRSPVEEGRAAPPLGGGCRRLLPPSIGAHRPKERGRSTSTISIVDRHPPSQEKSRRFASTVAGSVEEGWGQERVGEGRFGAV